MEFADVVAARRMVRRFGPDAVPAADLEAVLAAALAAPSAGHTQAVEFVCHREPASFWALTADPSARNPWLDGLRTAPLILTVWTSEAAYRARYAEPDKGHAELSAPWWWVDAGMAVEALLLAVVDRGLAGCFFGVPTARQPGLAAALGVPSGVRTVGAVAIGYADPERSGGGSAGRPRRGPQRIHHGRWGS